MRIRSPGFANNGSMPSKYTCEGVEINPPLEFIDVPDEAKSLALVFDDPDAPDGTWVHWLVWNIKPDTNHVDEDSVPDGAVEGATSFGEPGYGGPCPPDREHRYFFKLYALDTMLELPGTATLSDLEMAMDHHIIAEAELMGRYERKQ